jgi:hypothetical protein
VVHDSGRGDRMQPEAFMLQRPTSRLRRVVGNLGEGGETTSISN